MTSINAGGAFYRVQNSLNQNSEDVSKSMQRLASGMQNIAPGDRTASSAVAWGMKAEAASLKIGIQNGTEAMQAVEMLNNDIQAMNDIVVRLEELYALSTNGFNTTTDAAAIEAEADTLLTEIERIASDATWKGNVLSLQSGTGPKVGFGRNGGELEIKVDDIDLPNVYDGTQVRALDAKDIAGVTQTAAAHDDLATRTLTTYHSDDTSALGVPAALATLKSSVDTMAVNAGALFNQVSNVMSHLGSLNAGYALDVASKMDVDFAGETTELAKGQILAQAGTAMLAQANAQGQGMLALIQS
ncbi:flagellin [Planktomarina temperata]|nr:flagellin [Planktomarina temperata]MDC1527135.1 flagellin [Planktomarina temperata]